jgi:hypothetical protein
MENHELLREYYEQRRGFAQRKFDELNEYQLKHFQSSFSYQLWRWSRLLDNNLKALRNKLWWK